jgi:YD repeat-containing protein
VPTKVTSASYATSAGTRTVSYATAAPWQVTSYANGTVAYAYDASSRLTQLTQQDWPASGSTATLTVAYNASGKVIEAHYPDYNATSKPDARATIAYDSATQATVKHFGTVAGVANQATRQTAYTWAGSSSNATVAGQLQTEVDTTASGTATTTYAYADDQQLESTETTSGGDVVAASEAVISDDVVSGSHEVTSETTVTATNPTNGDPTAAQLTTYEYDSQHRVTKQTTYRAYDPVTGTKSNPTLTLYSYDSYGNVSETQVKDGSETGTLVSDLQSTYDASGRLTCEKRWVSGSSWTETDYSNFAGNGEPQTTLARNVQLAYQGAAQDRGGRVRLDS